MAEGKAARPQAQKSTQMRDRLLEWMAYRHAGRIADITPELAERASARQAVDDFCVLGHLELEDGQRWRIAPPTLAGLPRGAEEDACAVLCGARTRKTLASMRSACESIGARIESIPVDGQPAVMQVVAPSNTGLASVAKAAGIRFQYNAALALLACTPAIRDWPRRRCAMVEGRVEKVLRFSRSRIGWVDSTLAEARTANAGFFRIKRDWDWVNLLKIGEAECAAIDYRAGRLAAASKLRAAAWCGESRTLSLPSQLFPPLLIARGLALCTGRLPQHEEASRRISFGGVAPEIRKAALAIMGVRLA